MAQGEAGTAIVSVCEKLLERQDAAVFAAKLLPPLEKVASTNDKAKSLLPEPRKRQVQSRPGWSLPYPRSCSKQRDRTGWTGLLDFRS